MASLADGMPATDTATGDPLSVRVRKTVNASPERAFAALTEPDLVVAWWGPAGFASDWADIDPRPGGTLRIHMAATDGSYEGVLRGTYLTVEPPTRLSFRIADHCNGAPELFDAAKMAPTLVEIVLRPIDGGRTEITLTHSGFQDAVVAGAHEGGWSGAFEKLAQAVATRPSSPSPRT